VGDRLVKSKFLFLESRTPRKVFVSNCNTMKVTFYKDESGNAVEWMGNTTEIDNQ
jgi:hypothetical protein